MEPTRIAVAPLSPFLVCLLYCNTEAKAVDTIHVSLVTCCISLLSCYLPAFPLRPKRFKSSFSVRFTIFVFRNGQRGHLATTEDWIKQWKRHFPGVPMQKSCSFLGDLMQNRCDHQRVTFSLDVSL